MTTIEQFTISVCIVLILIALTACTPRMPGYFSVCNSYKVECRQ